MASREKERRRYEHIVLPKPLVARFSTDKVFIVDISVNGAKIAHEASYALGKMDRLRFEWQGQELGFDVEVLRCEEQRAGSKIIYQSGVFFVEEIGSSASVLKNLICDHVMRVLDERRANAHGIPPLAPTYLPSAKKSAGYFIYHLVKGNWSRSQSANADQPPDGFAVSATETEENLRILCRSYEESDYEGRKMIRKMAELSVSATDGQAGRKYNP